MQDKFETMLAAVDLKSYRNRYGQIKIVEMDLDKDVQAIELLYKVYWDERNFLSFDEFYKRYLREKKNQLEKFRKKTTMCKDCFSRGIEARIYRTWAGLITQIHGGYVAESVFGPGSVSMSRKLDSQGADIRVRYKGQHLNYQVKKTSFNGVMSRRPLPRKSKLEGRAIDIKYEVPTVLSDPKKKDGTYREPYLRFIEDKRTRALKNGFVIFTPAVFKDDKAKIDKAVQTSRV